MKLFGLYYPPNYHEAIVDSLCGNSGDGEAPSQGMATTTIHSAGRSGRTYRELGWRYGVFPYSICRDLSDGSMVFLFANLDDPATWEEGDPIAP